MNFATLLPVSITSNLQMTVKYYLLSINQLSIHIQTNTAVLHDSRSVENQH